MAQNGIIVMHISFQNLHTNNSNTLSNSFMATSASTQPAGFSPQQNLVYSTISVRIILKGNNYVHINLRALT